MSSLADNRKAYHEYQVLEKYEAGIKLSGSEVKAVREGKVDFEGSFAKLVGGKIILLNLFIGRYSKDGRGAGSGESQDARRTRDLLLNEYEIQRLAPKISQKGMSLVPLKLYTLHGLIKVELGLVKGKKKHEVKAAVKARQEEIDLRREEKTL